MNAFKKEIHERALLAAREFKRGEAHLILILQEVEESKLFLDLGLTSLFQYAVGALGLSEDTAYNFITVSRKSKQMPILQEAILQGSVSVSKARKVANPSWWTIHVPGINQLRLTVQHSFKNERYTDPNISIDKVDERTL